MLFGEIFSTGDASVIVATIAFTGTWLAARNRKAIRRIDRAVNHQPDDAPTLIQRVIRLEVNQTSHSTWTATVLENLAKQIGVDIPPRPLPASPPDVEQP